MSIPFKMDPMATNAEPWPNPPDGETVFTEVNRSTNTVDIPMPYLLNYKVRFDLNFPWYGTLQWTHLVVPSVTVPSSVTAAEPYVGLLIPGAAAPYTETSFLFLTENPLPGAGVHYDVACKSYIHNTPMACGPSEGFSEWFDTHKPVYTRNGQPSVFTRNADGTYTWVSQLGSTSPSGKPNVNYIAAEEDMETTVPDGKCHVQIKSSIYDSIYTALGAKFKFTPDPTRN